MTEKLDPKEVEDNSEDKKQTKIDVVEIVDWLDKEENNQGQQQSIDGDEDSSIEVYGDLGDLVSSDEIGNVINEMGFDVEKLDELPQELIPDENKNVEEGTPITFGDGYSTISVKIIENGRKAIIESLQFGDMNNPPTLNELKNVMESNYGIVHGFVDEKIEELINETCKRALWDAKFIIAEATIPEKAADGRVVYHVKTAPQTDKPFDGVELSKAMLGDDIRATLKIKGNPILVDRGAKIAEIETPQVGKPGINVFGQEIVDAGKLANRPVAGKGVIEDGDLFLAENMGYVSIIDNRLQVSSPLWVDHDRYSARFLYFPQPKDAAPIEISSLMGLIEKTEITYGIIESAIEKLANDGGGNKRSALLIARGNKVQPGVDAHFNPNFQTEQFSTESSDDKDESIDFRERNAYIAVTEGDLLGEFIPATNGVTGKTIFGEEVLASDGETIEFTIGEGVRVEAQSEDSENPGKDQEPAEDVPTGSDEKQNLGANKPSFLYANLSGSVRYVRNKLEVLPLLVINGDVDLNVGHISTRGDVKIGGSIQFGFNITAGGNIDIAGGVENGVTIRSEGDITVNKSVIGERTRLIAGGDVEARLIHNARVVAQGDITVNHSVVNARLSSGGSITINPGSGRVGSIVGGETFASTFIQAKTLGSPGMEPTRVGCRPSPRDLAQLNSMRNRVKKNREIVNKAMKWMGVNKFDKRQIDRALSSVPESQREAFAKALREGVKAAADLAQLPQQISKKEQDHIDAIGRGQIRASEAFFAEVVVEFGIRETRLLDKNVGGRYMLIEDEVRWRPPT
ncbi:MAG: flagellar assembly protein A [Candidatus Latescibacterota bacterium]|nr:flagellar assembly protein A [Candidatus Latescibacterota bacterium]